MADIRGNTAKTLRMRSFSNDAFARVRFHSKLVKPYLRSADPEVVWCKSWADPNLHRQVACALHAARPYARTGRVRAVARTE